MPEDRVRHNLPTQLTSFVGREAELGALATALASARLVTVVGPGGCGKTRVALETAHRDSANRPDGVWWVDLAAISDPLLVPELVGAAAAVLITSDQGATGALARQLDTRRMLVCLDNCEHVLGAAANVAVELIRSCPGVTVLATSREPLSVAGEVVWRVPPLAAADAIVLFEDRAGRPAASAAASSAIRTACARLDGIPLAIELAAAWSDTLSAQQILQGLGDRFSLLIRGPRGVPARHQTLATSMAWSYDLLQDADRVLFRRLGVCQDGFTLATAEHLCGGDDVDVLGGLRRLVDKSLVVADTHGSVARYRMLETVRQYAYARLVAAAELDVTRDRHLDSCLALVEEAAPLLVSDKDAWLARVGADHENLRAAIEWGLSGDDADHAHPDRARPDRARRLAAGLAWLWHLNGRGHVGLTLLCRAITAGDGQRTELQGRLLTGLALVADTTRPLGLEYDAAETALDIAAELGLAGMACLARLLTGVGLLYDDLDAAWSLAEAARGQAEEADDGFVVDGATALMGIVLHLRDRHDEALAMLRTAVAGLLRRRDRGVASTAIGFMALSALYTGDLAGARAHATEAVRTAGPLADYHRIGSASGVLAAVEMAAARPDAAHAALDPVVRLVAGAEPAPFVPGLAHAMGRLRLCAGRADEAVTWFRQDSAGIGDDDDRNLSAPTLIGLAAALRATGDVDRAAECCDRALTLARRLGMPRVVADALEQSAVPAAESAPDHAADLHHQALALRADHGLWPSCVDSLEALAALATRSGCHTEAARLLAACAQARADLGYPRQPQPDRDVADRLRTALGAEAFDVACAEGGALTIRAAIDYARRARGKRGRPASGWASLTPTERSVVRLASEGLSNPEIGSRLFMSRSTVKTHLSHVYAKLDVTNRTELATLAGPHLDRPPA